MMKNEYKSKCKINKIRVTNDTPTGSGGIKEGYKEGEVRGRYQRNDTIFIYKPCSGKIDYYITGF